MDKTTRIKEIKKELSHLPKGTLTYKHINGKNQPYLQWAENGKCNSIYIKLNDRERILLELEKKRVLERELKYLETYSVKIARILSQKPSLAGKPYIGAFVFEDFRKPGILYVDKTKFIEDWWMHEDKVTLITRPRRFGKSLMMSSIDYFFSMKYAHKKHLFDELYISYQEDFKSIQNTYPVINLTFAAYKSGRVEELMMGLSSDLFSLLVQYRDVVLAKHMNDDKILEYEEYIQKLKRRDFTELSKVIPFFSQIIFEATGRGPIILIDEYDTPIQEAFFRDKQQEMADFYRSFINGAIKSNPYFERAILTGVTCVAKESFFSDMNNITISSVTSDLYADAFGFTESELFDILDCQNDTQKQLVKKMYDGFTFGHTNNIYNPWSIMNYISQGQLRPYWVHSGGIGLISRIILGFGNEIKKDLLDLMNGNSIHKSFVEEITFSTLYTDPTSVWSLLLAAGYLTASNIEFNESLITCDLRITNQETYAAYSEMFRLWLAKSTANRSSFCKYLLLDDVENMNDYMNAITLDCISTFDVGNMPSEKAPERFYHGFVLGLLIDLRDEYQVVSNRESGFGRYDIMLIPKRNNMNGIIIEFKVFNEKREKNLEETAQNALKQIESKKYETQLLSEGVPMERIRKYAFAFEGKEVLIVKKNGYPQ